MDVSADLTELGRTPVAVVCAGVKVRPGQRPGHGAGPFGAHGAGETACAVCCPQGNVQSILDIGRTLEYLETQGVPVVTIGPTADFPAFYTATSGFKAPLHATTARDAAALLHAHRALGLNTGVVFGAPAGHLRERPSTLG